MDSDTMPAKTPLERDLIEGLEKVRAGGPTLMRAKAAKKTSTPLGIRLGTDDWTRLALCQHSAALFVGRSVSAALVIRRALDHYAAHVTALLKSKDPRAQAAEDKAIAACR